MRAVSASKESSVIAIGPIVTHRFRMLRRDEAPRSLSQRGHGRQPGRATITGIRAHCTTAPLTDPSSRPAHSPRP